MALSALCIIRFSERVRGSVYRDLNPLSYIFTFLFYLDFEDHYPEDVTFGYLKLCRPLTL